MWCFCLALILVTAQESSWSPGIWTKCQPSPSRRAVGDRLQSVLTELLSQRNSINNNNIEKTDWEKPQIHSVIWAKSSDFRPQYCVLGRGAAQWEESEKGWAPPLPLHKAQPRSCPPAKTSTVFGLSYCPSKAFLEFWLFSLSAFASPCGSSQSS